MNDSIIEKFLNTTEKRFYSDSFLFCSMIICLIFSIIYFRRNKLHSLFFAYSTIFLITIVLVQMLVLKVFKIPNQEKDLYILLINNLLIITEFTCYYYLYYPIIKYDQLKKILLFSRFIITTSTVISIVIILILFTSINLRGITHISYLINMFEFVILLLTCLQYFFQVNKEETDLPLKDSPLFWISSGILIYVSASIPFMSAGDLLYPNEKKLYTLFFSVHYYSLGLLFLAISKALTLKKQLTE